MGQVRKQCALYTTEAYYDPGWVRTLLMLNCLYLEVEPALAEDARYKNSALWIAEWLLELVQRRLQLSANNVCVTLERLLKERDSLVEYLESSLNQPTSIELSKK